MKDYYVGLDVGTDSVGWAVTNKDYSLCKFKGNAMWGVRLLEESKTAEERRSFRTSRRRNERNRFRIDSLQMLFDKEISKIDPAFFIRLKESNLYEEDKKAAGKYSVFNDISYTDKDYHKAYPTIYHLRKELAESSEPHDVRLVYLAVSHIIKNRGHFLFDSDFSSEADISDFSNVWEQLNLYLSDNYNIKLDIDSTEPIEKNLRDASLTKSKKKDLIVRELSLNKKFDTQKIAVITLLTGGSCKPYDLFADEEFKESECKSICISSGYDENASDYQVSFREHFELIERIKAVSDWAVLANILKNQKYISFAKTEVYQKHKSDLKLLKRYVREYCAKEYKLIFSDNREKLCNYAAYSKHTKNPSPVETNCTQEKFCEFLRKTLLKDSPSKEFDEMYAEIAAGSFMPKMTTKDNSVIPMQVTRDELTAILNNACKYLPFLNEQDESGLMVKDKILFIHSFKIPYYVGPLNPHSEKAWLIRKEGKIYPWNFEEIVDVEKSAEEFINNLTSKCTYLPKEDVIPKNSLLYSAFTVLNELNNLRVNGEKISVSLKQSIYIDLFLKKNKVTQAALKKYLASYLGSKDFEISGIDGDFKSSLKSWRDLEGLGLSLNDKEELIKAITIFGDDKKLLRKRMKANYGNLLKEDEIKKLSSLKYTGWSRLSRKFLTEIYGIAKKEETGEAFSIIRAMWETNNNLMQLLSSDYTFSESIKAENGEVEFTSLKDEVEALYVSPKVKRPIYQSMQIMEEIVKIMGCSPKKIFVEVARGDEKEKKRTVSRKQRLLDLYKNCKREEQDLYQQLQGFDDTEFRRDALYLYFTQFGRCMYTGKKIELSQLYNKNIYDIDHIFPRSKIKDDSLDNRVLVLKTYNAEKENIYPIKAEIRSNMHDFWKTLLNRELISKRKYERLIRSTPLTDEELSQFIQRQIVETRQSTKAIAQLLDKRYSDSEIVYVKADLVSDFRHSNDMLKSRDVNDLHHAKDAYLNVVVGNVYNTQFNHNRSIYIKGLQNGTRSVKKLFDYPVKGAWETENNKSMDMVKSTMLKNNIRFTRYSYKQKGGLFDQNPLKKGFGQVSIKQNSPVADIDKYGGYNGAAATCFAFVSYKDKKGKEIKAIVPIDLYRVKEYEKDPISYLSSTELLKDAEDIRVIIPCIKYNTLISINGFRMHISCKSSGGKNLVCKPAVQLALGYTYEKYIKHISNYLNKCRELKKEKEVTKFDEISCEENLALYNAIIDKISNSIYKERFLNLGKTLTAKSELFSNLSIYEQCFTLMEILNILHANVRTGDLSKLDEAKQSGKATIGNKIEKSKTLRSFKIIHQSVTGLYENEVELLK